MTDAPRIIGRYEPGYWMVRLVKHGPEVPACIVRVHTTHEPGNPENLMERSPFLAAFILGEPVDLDDVWERKGRAITEAEYRYQLADQEWAVKHAPALAKANPRAPIDLMTHDIPF